VTSANGQTRSERQIRALIDDLAIAIRIKDVDALMGHYAPDVLTFDLLPPLQYSGADAIRKGCLTGFRRFKVRSALPCST